MPSRHDPTILTVAVDQETATYLSARLQAHAHVELATTPEEAQARLDLGGISVMVCGTGLEGRAAHAFLHRCVMRNPAFDVATVVTAAGKDLSIFNELVDDDRLFYLTAAPIPKQDLVAILHRALQVRHQSRQVDVSHLDCGVTARIDRRVLEVTHKLYLQEDLASAGELAVHALTQLLDADRAYCLVHDEVNEILLSSTGDCVNRVQSTAAGLASFAARIGHSLLVQRAAADPRYDRDADDPEGTGNERLLIEPVVDASRRVLAVLVAVRPSDGEEFDRDDLDVARFLAAHVFAAFSRLLLQARIREGTNDQLGHPADIFRDEALQQHMKPTCEGRVLDLSRTWVGSTYWLVVAAGLLGFLFATVAEVSEYASGPAVVRLGEDSTISIVAVVPGHFRPRLELGDTMRFELLGYPRAYQALRLIGMGDEVIGPDEAGPLLGITPSRGANTDGRVVLLHARAPAQTFIAGAREYPYYDGMTGRVEIELGSQRVIHALIPGS